MKNNEDFVAIMLGNIVKQLKAEDLIFIRLWKLQSANS